MRRKRVKQLVADQASDDRFQLPQFINTTHVPPSLEIKRVVSKCLTESLYLIPAAFPAFDSIENVTRQPAIAGAQLHNIERSRLAKLLPCFEKISGNQGSERWMHLRRSRIVRTRGHRRSVVAVLSHTARFP